MNSSAEKPIYVRIKRRNQTYFVRCNPTSDNALYLKEQVATALSNRPDEPATPKPNQMRLFLPNGDLLDDDASLEDFKNEDELHVVFQISQNEWESVDVVSTQDQMMAD